MAPAAISAGPARCRCGHYPTQHMVIVPDLPGRLGGFHNAPVGPCVVCGAAACAKYVRNG